MEDKRLIFQLMCRIEFLEGYIFGFDTHNFEDIINISTEKLKERAFDYVFPSDIVCDANDNEN